MLNFRVMCRDVLFSVKQDVVAPFIFSKEVSDVFDNMITRSVPFYWQMQQLITLFAQKYVQPNTAVLDLGCSTGDTLSKIAAAVNDDRVDYVGIDKSPDMLQKAQERFSDATYIEADVAALPELPQASLVNLFLTLQFVPVSAREDVLRRVYDTTIEGGACILVEKVSMDNQVFFDELYDEAKRASGYSETEIYQKKEALKTVLVPVSVEQNIAMMRAAGFKEVRVFFQWLQFVGIVGVR